MGTDGSVQDPIATHSFVISISQPDVEPCVLGGGFLPPTAQYLDPYSKHPEAAAAAPCWTDMDTRTPSPIP
jgi:hypothetical protein